MDKATIIQNTCSFIEIFNSKRKKEKSAIDENFSFISVCVCINTNIGNHI